MAAPVVCIKLHDIPDAESCVRGMQRAVRAVAARYPALTTVLFGLAGDGGRYEAHLDLRFPQHQIIVNATASTTERAVHEVMANAADELARLEARDPSVAPQRQAKAA